MRCPNCNHEFNAAAQLGSTGGKKSSANMTAEERKERAKKAAQARWAKKKELPIRKKLKERVEAEGYEKRDRTKGF